MDPANYDWVWLRCLQQGVAGGSVLPWRLLQLYTPALGKEHDLCVNVRLSPRDLRLGQRRIVGLFIKGGDIGAFPLPGVEHDWGWAMRDRRELNTLLKHCEAAVILLPLRLIYFIPGLMEHQGF